MDAITNGEEIVIKEIVCLPKAISSSEQRQKIRKQLEQSQNSENSASRQFSLENIEDNKLPEKQKIKAIAIVSSPQSGNGRKRTTEKSPVVGWEGMRSLEENIPSKKVRLDDSKGKEEKTEEREKEANFAEQKKEKEKGENKKKQATKTKEKTVKNVYKRQRKYKRANNTETKEEKPKRIKFKN